MGIPIGRIEDRPWVMQQLRQAGLAEGPAEVKADWFGRCAIALLEQMGDEERTATAWYVPGRIEILGKHTDYAGGRSLVAALERGFCGVAVGWDAPTVEVHDVRTGARGSWDLGPQLIPATEGWSNYAMTASRRLARNFPGAGRGGCLALASDLPSAAGMSSSSALIVAIYLMLADVNAIWGCPEWNQNICSREDLAEYLGTVENGQTYRELQGDRGVGTFGGSEDHTAILCSRSGYLSQYSYCPVRFERRLAVPDDLVFAIGVSGVAAEKTGAARESYNRISQRVSKLTELWRGCVDDQHANLGAILRSSPANYGRLRKAVYEACFPAEETVQLLHRLRHFKEESETIITDIPGALEDHSALEKFGELVDRSQEWSASLLGNQIPETEFLAQSARSLGALAASAFGAGFGGSVWALVPKSEAESFCADWSQQYRVRYPVAASQAVFFTSGAGPAAFRFTPTSSPSGNVGDWL